MPRAPSASSGSSMGRSSRSRKAGSARPSRRRNPAMTVSISDRREELAQALRRLRRDWAFSTAFVMTLALGIAANLAVFSALDAYFLRPLPYPQSGRLIDIYFQTAKFPLPPGSISGSGYEQLQSAH